MHDGSSFNNNNLEVEGIDFAKINQKIKLSLQKEAEEESKGADLQERVNQWFNNTNINVDTIMMEGTVVQTEHINILQNADTEYINKKMKEKGTNK